MNARCKYVFAVVASLALFTLAGCDQAPTGHSADIVPGKPQTDPQPGQSSFVSADGQPGESSPGDRAGQEPADGSAGGDNRSVEEGDIYRVSASSHLILNLNAYRGFQELDFSDVAHPKVVGSVQVAGEPVEMYQVGERVYALVNGWRGYYGSRTDLRPTTFSGGLVLTIDVSDPTAPRVTGRAQVDGYIRTSRLTRGDGSEALYVVATDGQTTYVRSFAVASSGELTKRSDIDLGGYVADIQATPTRLLVASNDGGSGQGSDVSVIDISDPDGHMVEGGTVRVQGKVASKTNIDVDGDILRVVSGNDWSNATRTNHIETFDISDLSSITPVDHATFGDGEQLYATIFVGQKAFCVTYQRVDPLHAFEISAQGQITERSQFVVSGWNDFFKPVANNTRLLGVGVNDQDGRKLAVSLYDISDLNNANPLLSRAEVGLQWSSSEANWDDRAFTVLEGATSVTGPGGVEETGLVLLPFSGWNDGDGRYESGVQIFTFSANTLTRRGVMLQDSPVRRSFLADPDARTAGNLSEVELSLFDAADPDAPAELGRVELAPNYTDFFVVGDHGVRRHSRQDYYYWWGDHTAARPDDQLEVVALAGDVDQEAPVASMNIPAGARVYRVGDLLTVVSQTYVDSAQADKAQWQTRVDVWDVSDPTAPTKQGSLTTRELPVSGYYYGDPVAADGGATRAMDSPVYVGWGGGQVMVTASALVFPEAVSERELVGTEHVRYISPVSQDRTCAENTADHLCSFLTGGISCRHVERPDGTHEPEVCSGAIYRCDWSADGSADCTTVDADSVETRETTYDWQRYRYWVHYNLHSLDLRDPAHPALGKTVASPADHEAVSMLAAGSRVFLSYKTPYTVPDDGRSFVRFFFEPVDFSDPQAPVVGAGVNIPGDLIAVDGQTLITRDHLWGDHVVESSVNKLRWQGSKAVLEGTHRFTDRYVQDIRFDGAGHVLVTHRGAWWWRDEFAVPADGGGGVSVGSGSADASATSDAGVADAGADASDEPADPPDRVLKLSVLDAESNTFDELSQTSIDDWATLRDAVAGRALFAVPGGMLVVNLDDPQEPYAQAYFPLRGWPSQVVVDGREVFLPAGRYGLYRFGLDDFNLLQTE